MKFIATLLLFTLVLVSGCISLQVDEGKLAEMHRRGSATLEPSSQDEKASISGPRMRRFYAASIDGVLTKGGINRVSELEPGNRKVVVAAYIQDPRFGGYDLKLGDGEVSFEARSGARYRVVGSIAGDQAEIWISIVETGQTVTEPIKVKLKLDQHRAPILVPVPI